MDYSTLTLDEVRADLERTTADVRAAFGGLNVQQLNWKIADSSWSVAQCLEHLVNANREMGEGIRKATAPGAQRAFWQRVPGWPRLGGRLMVRSLAPVPTRKLKAPPALRPSASAIAAGVVERFADSQQAVANLMGELHGRDLGAVTMISPFASFVSYSVLDALRIIATHERRHVEQAKRVMAAPGFPR